MHINHGVGTKTPSLDIPREFDECGWLSVVRNQKVPKENC